MRCDICGIDYSSEYFSKNVSICNECYEKNLKEATMSNETKEKMLVKPTKNITIFKIIINALLISILITIIYFSVNAIIFSTERVYEGMSPDDWKNLEDMSYKEAQKYIREHTRERNGFEILINRFTSIQILLFTLKNMFRTFMLIFITALIVAFRIIKLKDTEQNKIKDT